MEAFIQVHNTASSTSNTLVPHPMPYILRLFICSSDVNFVTCSRAYEPFRVFGLACFFLSLQSIFPLLPSSSSPRSVSSIAPKISAKSHLSFPFHIFLFYSFLIHYYLPQLTHTLNHQSKFSHLKSSHHLKFKAMKSLDHL